MPPSKKIKYYAVAVGRQIGIYETWSACEAQVKAFPNARYKAFPTIKEAETFIEEEKGKVVRNFALLENDNHNSGNNDDNDINPDITSCSEKIDLLQISKEVAVDNMIGSSLTHALIEHIGKKRVRETMEAHNSKINEEYEEKIPENYNIVNNNNNNNNNNYTNNLTSDMTLLKYVSSAWISDRLKEAVEVYVDGACRHNGKDNLARAGYGGHYGSNDPRNFSLPLSLNEKQSNNRAELRAVIHVLQTALQAEPCYNLIVYTDSKYVLSGMESYMLKWRRNGFMTASGSSVLNVDLWRTLNEVRWKHAERYAIRIAEKYNIRSNIATQVAHRLALVILHVRGHSGVHGNEMADLLARRGADMPRKKE